MIIAFDTEIVNKIGNVNDTILLTNIFYWVKKNKANQKNFKDGRYWTYNSYQAFEQLFPFLTARQIRYSLDKLKKNGYLMTGNFNKVSYDNTLWYTLTEKGFNVMGESERDGYLECNSPFNDEDNFEKKSDCEEDVPNIIGNIDVDPDGLSNYIIPHDKNVKSSDKNVKSSDKNVNGVDKIVKGSDKNVKPIPNINTNINTNKQQQTIEPLQSNSEATINNTPLSAAVSFVKDNYPDSYNLCVKYGIELPIVAHVLSLYPPDTVMEYVKFTAHAVSHGFIHNPTGFFLDAIKNGYNVQSRLNPGGVPPEVISQTEKDIQERDKQKFEDMPPITPDSPFYKYYKQHVLDAAPKLGV